MSQQGHYQVGILGKPNGAETTIGNALQARLTDLGIDASALVTLSENQISGRDRKKPFIGIFFGYDGASDADHPILADLINDSVVIVPIVPTLEGATKNIPRLLADINCIVSSSGKPNTERLVSVLLENFRLLRAERRLFISYKRSESQGVAIQLYETLDALGFDVFLDTRGVPPATDFQSVLWHRLADSDVVLLLDTPKFRESRWTVQELARANTTSVQILHFLWPGVAPDSYSAFSQFVQLDNDDFASSTQSGADARLDDDFIGNVGAMVEDLRARAMSARYRYLVDNFCDQARSLNQHAAVQSTRFVVLDLSNNRRIAVVPAIGVPNAQRYQDIAHAIADDPKRFEKVWLLYDERGILQGWLEHLEWLNEHLPVLAVRVSGASALVAKEAA